MLAEDAIKSAISNYYTKNPSARTTNLGGTGADMPKIDVESIPSQVTAAWNFSKIVELVVCFVRGGVLSWGEEGN